MSPVEFYEHNLILLREQKAGLTKKKNAIGLIRFGNIILLIIAFYYLYSVHILLAITSAIVLLFIFTRLIYADLKNKKQILHIQRLIFIHENELKMGAHQWQGKTGEEYMHAEHGYANDMDIFGHASLFQYINRTSTEPGADKLSAWLLEPASPDIILERQNAVKELKVETSWRHDLMALGQGSGVTNATVANLDRWIKQPTIFLQWKPWELLRWLLPIPMILLTITTIFSITTISWFLAVLFIYSVMAYQVNKIVAPLHEQLSGIVAQAETFAELVDHIEKKQFESKRLNVLKGEFEKGASASLALKRLNKILERLDLRYNIVVSAPLNLLLLWNLQQVLDLEKWKKIHSEDISRWIYALAEFESLNCLGSLAFNHPEWCFPTLSENHFELEVKQLGHPLIPGNKMVYNDVFINRGEYITLITGSNMAGKSTFLRSAGLAMIMGMSGGPVCAVKMHFSPARLISSMRITDNLEESTSTFYAELKKLKRIIESVNHNERVFILLDEILRGTNSMDRHKGSEALIKQLIRMKAYSVIATHDLVLAEMEKDFPNEIENYHFDVSVNGEDLYFDYKLKEGVCRSLNATLLMKKIGLDI